MATTDNKIRLAAGISQDKLSHDQSRKCGDSSADHVRSATSKTETEEILVNHEIQAVNRFRAKLLVYLALLLTSVAVGATAFVLSTKEEKEDFEAEYTGLTREVIDNIAIKGPRVAITSNAIDGEIDGNKTRLNATMPYLDLFTHEALASSSKIAFPSIVLVELTPNAGVRARKIFNFTDQVREYEEFY